MQTPDYPRFNALMNAMGKVYEREIDKPLLDGYWLALRNWSIEEFESAAGHLMETHKYAMPKPGDFTQIRKAGRPTAGEAWVRALEHCESGAWRRGFPTDDPLVDAAAKMVGGFEAIALCETAKLGFVERRFCEHYEALQDVTDTRTALPQLTQDERLLGLVHARLLS